MQTLDVLRGLGRLQQRYERWLRDEPDQHDETLRQVPPLLQEPAPRGRRRLPQQHLLPLSVQGRLRCVRRRPQLQLLGVEPAPHSPDCSSFCPPSRGCGRPAPLPSPSRLPLPPGPATAALPFRRAIRGRFRELLRGDGRAPLPSEGRQAAMAHADCRQPRVRGGAPGARPGRRGATPICSEQHSR